LSVVTHIEYTFIYRNFDSFSPLLHHIITILLNTYCLTWSVRFDNIYDWQGTYC